MTDVLDKYEALHLEATSGRWEAEIDDERAVALVRLTPSRGVYPSQRAPIERDIDFDGGPQGAEALATVDLIAASRNTVLEVIALAKAAADALEDVGNTHLNTAHMEQVKRRARLRAALDAFLSALSKEVK